MLPLSQLASRRASLKNQIKGVVFDIDDTLTRNGILELEAYQSIWRLKRAGYKLIAATGRPLGWADVFAAIWPIDVAVGENGAGYTYVHQHSTHQGYMYSQQERQLQQELLSRVKASVNKQMPDIVLSSDSMLRRCDIAFDIGESVHIAPERVEELCHIIESHACLSATSSVHAHAIPAKWNKVDGIKAAMKAVYQSQLELEREDWIYIGDSPNDSAAFDYFPLSIGVANIYDTLSLIDTPPAYVCQSDRGKGFRELAELLLK